KNSSALWNANKLQNSDLGISTPSVGQILRYKDSKWTNDAESVYTSGMGINVQDKVINAKNNEAIWNANKLQGKTISTTSPVKGHALRYDGTNWTPSIVKELSDGTSSGQLLVWTSSG